MTTIVWWTVEVNAGLSLCIVYYSPDLPTFLTLIELCTELQLFSHSHRELEISANFHFPRAACSSLLTAMWIGTPDGLISWCKPTPKYNLSSSISPWNRSKTRTFSKNLPCLLSFFPLSPLLFLEIFSYYIIFFWKLVSRSWIVHLHLLSILMSYQDRTDFSE